MIGRQMWLRSALTVGLPFVLIWAFAADLWRGQRAAFRSAWLEVRLNIASYRELMQREDL
ncbi:hypothetical protein A1D31_22595 [Bradyrhizobium liaoningense]|nr:hypothetical protein A1D31_22595 [Bradyrhizobium liaoningense]